ncbi:MAG: superoxide dismutase family protein [Oscillospiraceae bacterium]|nr:superoxide dismutase family protein [Oscillospiraceae bacterium]
MNYNFKNPNAVAVIYGEKEAPCLSGEVRFYQDACSVLVVADVYGLPKESKTGFFALHIHEGKSCSGKEFSQTGSHYNPKYSTHPKHAGDLPPLLSCDGCAYLAVRTDRFCVRDIIGRTVVIHSGQDDFTTQPAGNAGVKIGCGEICAR